MSFQEEVCSWCHGVGGVREPQDQPPQIVPVVSLSRMVAAGRTHIAVSNSISNKFPIVARGNSTPLMGYGKNI